MTALPTNAAFSALDAAYMRMAIGLARRGLGNTAPNPNVGCVVVHPEHGMVGRGWTQPGGRPHAETEALGRAGKHAHGAHAYVTLEPCNHHGSTGPCSEALIAAGVAAVTIAIEDPDPRVAGTGIERLRDAGVSVRVGLLADAARHVAAGFLAVQNTRRPWVTLKTATTLDGKIAAHNGRSKWITGPAARRRGHLLRAQNDAILTGIGTVLADDPEMTCRLVGLADRSPQRVVLDSSGRLTEANQITQANNQTPTLHVTGPSVSQPVPGTEHIGMATDATGRIDLGAVLETLAERGITRVLVEAGSILSAAFLAQELVDEIAWFRAPKVMGGDGIPAFADLDLDDPGIAARYRRIVTIPLDEDVLERYLRADTEEQ